MPYSSGEMEPGNGYLSNEKSIRDSVYPDSSDDFMPAPEMDVKSKEANIATDIDSSGQLERKKVYNGFCELEVVDIEKTKDTIREHVISIEGYIEGSYDNRIVFRVPAEKFQDTFYWLLKQGKVLEEEIETWDITDQFNDLDTRLQLAKQTQERLYSLLGKTTDVEEKLRILQEIRRLSEVIESINQTLIQMEKAADFSRIDIILHSLLQNPDTRLRSIPFPWISDLRPGFISLEKLGKKIDLNLGDDFAVFENKSYFYAESFNGIRLAVASTPNVPEGDAGFWQQALDYHLSPSFASSGKIEITDKIMGVSFKSLDLDPFYYDVYIKIHKKKIIVFEMFYPDEKAYTESAGNLRNTLAEVKE